jgi:DNA-binding transcriptional LysR family regulator
MIEIRHLRYFAAVAEELHFGRAARRLRIAQPPLSRQIRALEENLGCQLLVRNPRRVALTEAGRVFLEAAGRVFRELDAAVDAARRTSRGELGSLSIGYVPSAAYSRLPALLRAFHERFPSVEIRVRELPPADQVQELMRGHLDAGLVRGPVDEPALASETILEEPLVAVLPARHPLARRRQVPLADLASEPFVLPVRTAGPSYHDHILALCSQAGFVPRIAHHQAGLSELLSLVAAGFGVSVVPASLRRLAGRDLAYRPLVGAPTSPLILAWPSTSTSPVLRTFRELARRAGAR